MTIKSMVDTLGERRLWSSLLNLELVAAFKPFDSFERAEARRWLLNGNSRSFIVSCIGAGRDPEVVTEWARAQAMLGWPPKKGQRPIRRTPHNRHTSQTSAPVGA